jgi:hypothetical protein
VNNEDSDIEQHLSRLARETRGIGPRPNFNLRVMDAVAAEAGTGFLDGLWSSSRRFLPVAAFAAAIAVAAALQGQSTVDDALAASYGTQELEW